MLPRAWRSDSGHRTPSTPCTARSSSPDLPQSNMGRSCKPLPGSCSCPTPSTRRSRSCRRRTGSHSHSFRIPQTEPGPTRPRSPEWVMCTPRASCTGRAGLPRTRTRSTCPRATRDTTNRRAARSWDMVPVLCLRHRCMPRARLQESAMPSSVVPSQSCAWFLHVTCQRRPSRRLAGTALRATFVRHFRPRMTVQLDRALVCHVGPRARQPHVFRAGSRGPFPTSWSDQTACS